MTSDAGFRIREFRRSDLPGVAALTNARLAAEGDGEHITVSWLATVTEHLQNCDPETDIAVAVDAAGEVVGSAITYWRDVSEGYRAYHVGFEALGPADGLGMRMLEWGVARATAIAASHDCPDRRLRVQATDGSARAAIVEASGFEPDHWSAVMVRPNLDDIPGSPLPTGLEIRPVTDDDLRAIWKAEVEAFRDHRFYVEQTETDWDRFRAEAAAGTELWQVAWDSEGVAGQVRTRVNDGEAERLGRRRAWTESISTRRDWRRNGVASALIATSLRQLAELGFDEAALGVDLGNPTGALGVYERLGYDVVTRETTYIRSL